MGIIEPYGARRHTGLLERCNQVLSDQRFLAGDTGHFEETHQAIGRCSNVYNLH